MSEEKKPEQKADPVQAEYQEALSELEKAQCGIGSIADAQKRLDEAQTKCVEAAKKPAAG